MKLQHFAFAALIASAAACVDNPASLPEEAPRLSGTEATLSVIVPAESSAGLQGAAIDLATAVEEITDGAAPLVLTSVEAAATDLVVAVEIVEDDELGDQDYRIELRTIGTKAGIAVEASTDVGAMYGLYDIVGDMGVRYHHPEETFFPSDPDARLPWDYDGEIESPHFELRGFHEHTQHPIPMSDFYMRPEPEFRPYVSSYLRWLARNRQNFASFHMLKTVDLETWEPYYADIVDEGHQYGIDMGMVVSFVDQQQNNFKVIDDDDAAEEDEIRGFIDRFSALGIDFVTFQSGSTEFTKPADQDVIDWYNTAAERNRSLDEPMDLFSWIHITCDLFADDGSYFFHLPGETDPDIGGWVHTVMFHDLEHPAPVYSCENFQHQGEFIDAEDGERELMYFPESAWWLGFDNNMPLALPITGYTRQFDIQEALAGHDIRGHVTFTTGREWNYWQYDHFLTQITWDDEFGWPEYLEWMKVAYGEHGDAVAETTERWTELQRQNFFEDNPLIYFYVAGELRQDEIGEQAGILARRPKRSYQEIVRYDEDELAAWKSSEFDLLDEMLTEHEPLIEGLEAPGVPSADALSDVLYFEFYTSLSLYVRRIRHAQTLYEGVMHVREWAKAKAEGATEEDPLFQEKLDLATANLSAARAITDQALMEIQAVSQFYRYPSDILTADKPESLTSYKFGYLEQTQDAHFWTRRDDQLDNLIEDTFFERPDMWERRPDVLYFAEGEAIELLVPDNALASEAIAAFIPRMLFGLSGTIEPGSDDVSLTLGQDFNENFTPDSGTESAFEIDTSGELWTAVGDVYTFIARNSTGEQIEPGLSVFDPEITLEVSVVDGVTLEYGELTGNVASENLIRTISNVGGIDESGVRNLLKSIFGVPREEELPALLPFTFGFTMSPQP